MKPEAALPEPFIKIYFPLSYKFVTFSYFAFAQGNPAVKRHLNKQYKRKVIMILIPSLLHSFGYQINTK